MLIAGGRVLCWEPKDLLRHLNPVPCAINVVIIWCQQMLYSAVAVEVVVGCRQEVANHGHAPIATASAISGDISFI